MKEFDEIDNQIVNYLIENGVTIASGAIIVMLMLGENE